MKYFGVVSTLIFAAALAVQVVHSSIAGENVTSSATTDIPTVNETVHVFVLLVPNSALKGIVRTRQEEEEPLGAETFAQTGVYLGQTIQGVLGADLRPIFAGTVGFVDDRMVSTNLGGFFNAITPSLTLAFRELYTRAQTALGITQPPTTAIPTPHPRLNATLSSRNGTASAANGTAKAVPPTTTTSWQYVLNQIQASTTTVQPLPFLTRKPSVDVDEDGEDYKDQKKLVFDE